MLFENYGITRSLIYLFKGNFNIKYKELNKERKKKVKRLKESKPSHMFGHLKKPRPSWSGRPIRYA